MKFSERSLSSSDDYDSDWLRSGSGPPGSFWRVSLPSLPKLEDDLGHRSVRSTDGRGSEKKRGWLKNSEVVCRQ